MRIVLALLVEIAYCLFVILWAVTLSFLIFTPLEKFFLTGFTLFHFPF